MVGVWLAAFAVSASAETGVASTYWPGSSKWGGPLGPDGKHLDFKAMTVAHYLGGTKAMPLGSCLKIQFGHRVVEVKVDDNGPHTKGRKLDLKAAVARALHFPGLAVVSFWRIPCDG